MKLRYRLPRRRSVVNSQIESLGLWLHLRDQEMLRPFHPTHESVLFVFRKFPEPMNWSPGNDQCMPRSDRIFVAYHREQFVVPHHPFRFNAPKGR